MIAADRAVQRPKDARLLVVDRHGRIDHLPRARFLDLLQPADLVVANDAVTLPASLRGIHMRTGAEIEVRLAGRRSLGADDVREFSAIVFGAGDFRTRTEDRQLPPPLLRGDRLALGPALEGTVEGLLDHPRLIALRFDASVDAVWAGLARHGRPIQYSHMPAAVQLWDVWTPVAGQLAAFEPPSASFVVDWRMVAAMRSRGVTFRTITLAAGISSTGDAELDKRLPLDEPYRIPATTADAVRACRQSGGRVVAIGTTVVRALEHSASVHASVRAGENVATQRIGADTTLLTVDAVLSGTHEPDVSHYQLLRAFVDDATLAAATDELESAGYRTHEFGDSVFIERQERLPASRAA